MGIFLVGLAYFFIEAWSYDPFVSKARVQTKIDGMEYVDSVNLSGTALVNLDDDSALEKELQQVESEFQTAVKQSRAVQMTSSVDDESIQTAEASVVAPPWQVLDKTIVPEKLRLREGVEPVQIIQIDTSALESMSEGDYFKFPTINNKQYEVIVSKKKTLWNGDLSIRGTLQGDDGDTFPVVLSSGTNTTFASFSTPEGSFELEAFGNVGGLYSVNDMDKQAFHPETDELLH